MWNLCDQCRKLALISVGTPYNGLYRGGTLERVYFSQPYDIRKDRLIFAYSFLYRNGPREDRKKVLLWFANMLSMRSNEKGIYQFIPHKSKDSCSLHNWQIFVPEDLKYLSKIQHFCGTFFSSFHQFRCYCGVNLKSAKKVKECECRKKCKGVKKKLRCGGSHHVSLYNTCESILNI